MTTSQPKSLLFEILEGKEIPIGTLAYFRARLSNRIHQLVLSEFLKLEGQQKLSKAELARRIGRKPEQVTRWLAASGNWTIDTLSDLLLGMGREPTLSAASLAEKQAQPVAEKLPESLKVVITVPTAELKAEGYRPTTAIEAALPYRNQAMQSEGRALLAAQFESARFYGKWYDDYGKPAGASAGAGTGTPTKSPNIRSETNRMEARA